MKIAALTLLAVLAAPVRADDGMASLRALVGPWTGQMTCSTGNYGVGVSLFESEGGLAARYSAASGGETPMKTTGRVAIAPRGKPREFTAQGNGGASVKITLAEKSQVLIFAPDPAATGMAALIKFAGTARLDKKRTKAVVRYTVTTPLGSDPCMGSMTKSAPPAR